MSSETLERAQAIRAAIHSPGWHREEGIAALDALLAEVARLEQERDVEAELFNGAQAALAVARKREQHAVRALRSLRGWAYVESLAHGIEMPPNLAALLDAALVDEPAAATLAEPGKPCNARGGDADDATGRGSAPGSASAAADEPGETPSEAELALRRGIAERMPDR